MKRHRIKRSDKPLEPPPTIRPEEAQEVDYEICWCIEKLENMVVKSTNERDKKQCQQSLKALKNPETPLIRKRQLMRQHFGDYKKIIANSKKNYTGKSSVNVVFKSTQGPVRSIFIRKKQAALSASDANVNQNEKKICGIQCDNSFRFNF